MQLSLTALALGLLGAAPAAVAGRLAAPAAELPVQEPGVPQPNPRPLPPSSCLYRNSVAWCGAFDEQKRPFDGDCRFDFDVFMFQGAANAHAGNGTMYYSVADKKMRFDNALDGAQQLGITTIFDCSTSDKYTCVNYVIDWDEGGACTKQIAPVSVFPFALPLGAGFTGSAGGSETYVFAGIQMGTEQHFQVNAHTCLPTEVATFSKNAYPDANVLLGYQTVSNFVQAKNDPSIYDPSALKVECEEAAADAGPPKWGIRSAYNF